jgi:ABC-type xylose transport system permease subunit
VTTATWIIIGAAKILIGSSKYWQGWQTEYGDPLFSLGTWELRTFGVEVDEVAKDRPAKLMRWAFYPFAACGLALIGVLSLRTMPARERIRHVAVPLGLGALGAIGIVLAKRWIGDDPVNLAGWKSDQVLKFLAVAAAMASTMAGVFLLISPISRRKNPLEQSLFALTAVGGVFWLLGQTTIHQTTIQVPFFIMLAVAILAGVFLRQTIYGRYLFALGRNEEATRYSGVNTDRMIILAYVACAACAGLGGILFTLASNNVEPSGHGSFYELYAIAAAVLGGCSLRGGEGSVVGMILGAAIMRVLFNAPNMIGVAQQLELFTMGIVILLGVITDEQIRRAATHQK